MYSIKDIVGADDSKCKYKFEDVDEIRVNNFANGGPIVGVIYSKTATPESIAETYKNLGQILGGEIVKANKV